MKKIIFYIAAIGILIASPAFALGPDFAHSGSTSCDSESNPCSNATDADITTYWLSGAGGFPHHWQINTSSSYAVAQMTIYVRNDSGGSLIKGFSLQGSNDGSSWSDVFDGVYTSNLTNNSNVSQDFSPTSTTPYTYWKIQASSNWRSDTYEGLNEVYLYPPDGGGGGSSSTATLAPINDVSSTKTVSGNVYNEIVALPLFAMKNYETPLVGMAIIIALVLAMLGVLKWLSLL